MLAYLVIRARAPDPANGAGDLVRIAAALDSRANDGKRQVLALEECV